MTYVLRVSDLVERASQRAATAETSASLATVATLLPDSGRKVARVAGMPAPGRPMMTIGQADECHAGGWNNFEIDAFAARRDRLMRWGWPEPRAEELAERLTLRDRQQDDRRSCAECQFGRASRCPNGYPLPAEVLQRCATLEPPK